MIRDILVIEDNPGDALLVKEYLTGNDKMKFNFKFIDTLQKIEENTIDYLPDVILLDLTLPDSSGIKTFERVYNIFGQIPIIILSGYDDEDTAYIAVQKGAHDYLVKGKINEKNLQLAVIYAVERIKLLQSLYSSEQKFKLLTENAPIFIWMTDKNGRFIYTNKLLSNFLNFSITELLEKSMLDFIDVHSFDEVAEIYKRYYSINIPFSIEYNLLTGFTIYEKSIPYNDVKGDFAGFICTGLDLSEIKRVEKERNLNLERYEYLAENSMDVIWKMDLDLTTIYCNKAIYNFLGYTPYEFMDLKIEDYLTESSLEEVKKLLTKKLYIYDETNTFDDSSIEHLDLVFINKNGEKRYGEINARITYDFNQQNLIILGVTRDITEKQLAEEKIKNYGNNIEVLASSAIAFLEKPENIYKLIGDYLRLLIPNSFILVNSVVKDISQLEYIAGVETQIKNIDKLIGGVVLGRKTKLTPVALERLGKGKIIKLEGGLAEVTLNTISLTAIASLERIFNVSSVYVYGINKDENLLGSVIIVMKKGYEPKDFDIIEAFVSQATIALNRKISEESLKQSELRLRESNVAKDKFFSIISHDLRSPFQGILGYFDIITENFNDVSTDELYKILNNLKVLVHNQYDLLENLLEWANVQRGKRKLELQEISLCDLAEWILGVLRINAEKKGIEIIKQIPQEFIINADIEMLKSIINNLVTNAIKFTENGGKIYIIAEENKEKKFLIIQDTGVGMKNSDVENLFKIDKQVSKPGTNREKGTGLGLILCKEFIDLHGWKINVESKIGEGTKIIIEIEQKIY
ncbi:MAG TPA: PAS domain S-box protein [Melioribacteraceae bacterium]|mgnify:CR=1 FL=1|nr:PAS domain S-box protein [Melioribacteraceae bacterium]